MIFTTLAFHAEKLHQPQVWQKIWIAGRWLAGHGIRATFRSAVKAESADSARGSA